LEVQNEQIELGNFNLLDFPDTWPFDTAKGDSYSVSQVNGENIVTVTTTVPVVEVDANIYNAIQDSSFNRFVALSNNLTGIDSSTTCPEDFTNVLSPVLSQQLYDDPFESLDSMFPNPNADLF